jgi:DNA (cytosine-5)-methyltransferase 1
MRPLTVGSTFTGVGGADLGFEWAGFQIAWQCELDAWKRTILAAHWPDVQIFDDITTMLDPPPVDILIGGFPCQDLSVAGQRKGFTGERSVLAFEFLRLAESIRPKWLVLENVPGLLSSSQGADFARLIDEVVACGYGVGWRILDARFFGVPQRRRRVFIVARRTDALIDSAEASRLAFRAIRESGHGDIAEGWQAWQDAARSVGQGAPAGRIVGTLTAACFVKMSHQDMIGAAMLATPEDLAGASALGDLAGTLTRRYRYGVNSTVDDGGLAYGPVVSPTVTKKWSKGSGGPAGSETGNLVLDNAATAFRKARRAQTVNDDETWVEGDHSNTLNSFDAGDVRTTHAVLAAFYSTGGSQEGFARTDELSPTLKVGTGLDIASPVAIVNALDRQQGGPDDNSAQAGHLIADPMSVRRLTPTECERLMGWPDEWTSPQGVKAPDSKRYAACGDGIVAPVAFWIADRIRMIEEEEAS